MLNEADTEEDTVYKVVMNDEDQYSIWQTSLEDPPGWRDVGVIGAKAECLAYIEHTWTDMRPKSLKQGME